MAKLPSRLLHMLYIEVKRGGYQVVDTRLLTDLVVTAIAIPHLITRLILMRVTIVAWLRGT